MTDKIPPLSTQIAPPSQPPVALLSNGIPVAPPTVPKAETAAEEEEPYTIKCICDFTDDDGNTIYCETCDSWQHIECYYPDSMEDALREDFAHSCIDCKPRPLDRQKAIQRQRRRLDAASAAAATTANNNTKGVEEHSADKKTKRPPPKNPKKKPKQTPIEVQTNGGHPSSAHDHTKHALSHDHPHAPPSKKSKHSHKSSQSVSSQGPKRSPPQNAGRNGHPPSPAITPPDVPVDCERLYTPAPGFIAAYSDHHVNHVSSNSFAALNVSTAVAAWPRDPERLKSDAGCESKDVFRSLLPKSPSHQLKVERKAVNVAPDTTVPLSYLTTPVAIPKEEPLIELNGSIDFQKDYCTRPENRWDQLTFPLPFVFFHDTLPLCIDTRGEGSKARFVRRSCRPTARMETYLDPHNAALYHFMLVADRDIKPGEQITLPWDFRLPKETRIRWRKLLGLDVDDEDAGKPVEPQTEQEDVAQLREFIPLLLGEYGGCACELGKDCAFARFYAHWNGKVHAPPRPAGPKKRSRAKQPKAQPTVSPTNTGQATNSRATSEGRPEDVPEQDGQSASGSARSKPPSPDRTPAPGRQPSLEYGMLTAEPTEREKRKAAAFEENIRRTEEQKPKKKKTRISDAASASSTKSKPAKRESTSNASSATSATAGRHYVDAATPRSKSNSPAGASKAADSKKRSKPQPARNAKGTQTPRPISTAPRPVYADQGTQTDPSVDWYLEKPDGQPRRRVVSLAKRLLQNRHKQRIEATAEDRAPADKPDPRSPVTTEPPEVDNSPSPTAEKPPPAVPSSPTTQAEPAPSATSPIVPAGDTDMTDAPPVPSSPTKAPISTTPAQSELPGLVNKVKAAELRVQMPPVPAFNGPSSTTSTPLSATGSVNSPFSATNSLPNPFGGGPAVNGVAHPSPQRKKLSLSDYRKSRNMTTAAAKPSSSLSTATRAPPALEDSKVAIGQENASPIAGKASDSKPIPSSIPAATNSSL